MTGGLKDLAQNVLGDSRVESSHIERPLVRLGCCTAGKWAGAARRDDAAFVTAATHGRCDGSWNWIRVLWDVKRWGWQVGRIRRRVLTVFIARRTGARLGRGRELPGRGRSVISHLVEGSGQVGNGLS